MLHVFSPSPRKMIETIILALAFIVPLVIYTGTANANLIKTLIFNIGVFALFVLWALHSFQDRRIKWAKSPLHLPVLCFLVWNLVSVLLSQHRWISFNEFGKLLSYVFLYFMVVTYFNSKEKVNRLLMAVFAAAFLTCVYGMFQHWGYDWIDWYPKEDRILSSFGNPTFFAAYLVLLLPIAVNLFLGGKASWVKWGLGMLSGLMYICLLYTYTRATWLGFIFACIVNGLMLLAFLGVRRLRQDGTARLVGIIAGVLLVLTLCSMFGVGQSTNIEQRFVSSFQTQDASNVQRMTHWKGALAIFRRHPVIGTGIGTFQIYLPEYQSRRAYATGSTVITDHAHNEFLEQASETGVIGLALFLWLGVTCISMVIRVLRNSDDDYWRYLSTGLLCGLIAFIVQNMAGVSLRWVFGGMFFWMVLGLVAVGERVGPDEYCETYDDEPETPTARWIPAYCGAAIIVLVGAYCVARPFASEVHLKRGNLAADAGKWQEARKELEAAVRLDPYSMGSYYKLGHVYNTLRQYDKALKTYHDLQKLSPDYARIHYNTAAILINMERYDEAVAEYKTAIRLEDSAMNYMALAEVLANVGQTKPALDAANRAIKVVDEVGTSIGGAPADIYLSRGRLLYDAGRYRDALADYRVVTRMQPSGKPGHFYSGNCYSKLGDFNKAISEYKAALRFDPKDERLHDNMGSMYYAMGDYAKAVDCYKAALGLNPNDAYAHLNLGLVYNKRGQVDNARREFENASRLGGRSLVGVTATVAVQQVGS